MTPRSDLHRTANGGTVARRYVRRVKVQWRDVLLFALLLIALVNLTANILDLRQRWRTEQLFAERDQSVAKTEDRLNNLERELQDMKSRQKDR